MPQGQDPTPGGGYAVTLFERVLTARNRDARARLQQLAGKLPKLRLIAAADLQAIGAAAELTEEG